MQTGVKRTKNSERALKRDILAFWIVRRSSETPLRPKRVGRLRRSYAQRRFSSKLEL